MRLKDGRAEVTVLLQVTEESSAYPSMHSRRRRAVLMVARVKMETYRLRERFIEMEEDFFFKILL